LGNIKKIKDIPKGNLNGIIKTSIARGMSFEETNEIYEELFLKKWQEKTLGNI